VTSVQIRSSVLVCGYYGEHNLGDDALLQVLLAQLPPAVQPLVTAWDQPLVRRVFRVETTARRSLVGVLSALGRCRALVLGGGSLLQDSTSFRSLIYYAALIVAARIQGKDVILWGQGLGPLRRRRSRLLVRWLLNLATGISWRDPASTQLARRWGVRCLEGSDPVWGLEPLPWQGSGGPIVVCWRPVNQLDPQGWRPYLEALDQLAAASGRPVHWLPFHRGQDRELLAWLEQQGLVPERLRQASVLLAVDDPQAAMARFQAAGLVIAMRLHGLILAALAGSPCVALSYDPKVAEAAQGIGCPCQDLALPAPDNLLASWQATLDQPPQATRLEQLRRGAAIHREVLAPLSSLA
jgi:polysaccharide pyruvyl transferase CsaB